MQIQKRKPAYYKDFLPCKDLNLIFIAKDWNALNLIQRSKQMPCLFCEHDASLYDLDFCYEKEVWVLYSTKEVLTEAMNFAQKIQFLPAKKVDLIRVRMNNQQGVANGKW